MVFIMKFTTISDSLYIFRHSMIQDLQDHIIGFFVVRPFHGYIFRFVFDLFEDARIFV